MSVFLTGGGGGLGNGVAQAFAARGVAVALADRVKENAEAVASAVAAEHDVPVLPLECDVTDAASIARAWDRAGEELGPVDALVNSAGIFRRRPFLDLTEEEWNTTLDVNLTGAFLVSQHAVRHWLAAGTPGSIVHVASIAAMNAGFGGAVDYGASKAGLVGLTIHLAVEFAPAGIRCNAVAPGFFYSPINAARLADPEEEARSAAFSPLRRIGQPDEVASAVVFLAMDATYVNGTVLPVDGGIVVRM
jgi:NAD(P)-dependent dehydrogenase (short-subunit alcohol dehydrogenase family)